MTAQVLAAPTTFKPHKRKPLLFVIPVLIALTVALPLFSVMVLALFPSNNIWPHLFSTSLPGYVKTTLVLAGGVALGTALIGVPTAWLVTHYRFPMRHFFRWGMLLPFAVPAYVLAYVYTDLLDYAGPVQSSLRYAFGWTSARDYYFPSIRTVEGAMVMLTLVLYPYVFLLARAAFLEQSASVLEAAVLMGNNAPWKRFTIALSMARPAIVVGVSLALMETLNDFGTVDFFAVRTLTAGIYDVWLGMNNLGGGAQIACLLLVFVIVLFTVERLGRQQQQHYQSVGSRYRTLKPTQLTGVKAWAAFTVCFLPVLLGFIIPALILARYSISYFEESVADGFVQAAINSVTLAAITACVAVAVGLALAYSHRLLPGALLDRLIRFATLGYAVPGVVLAIGIMIPFGWFDNTLDAFIRQHFGMSTGLLLSGTIVALIFAYTVRFLAVAHGAIDSSLRKVAPSMDDAARSLGHSPLGILRRVHLPLIKGGSLTAALVVFVDVMKELPATLVMRPFNVETLATRVYQYASDELLQLSATAALCIVLAGLIPVILLSVAIDRSRQDT